MSPTAAVTGMQRALCGGGDNKSHHISRPASPRFLGQLARFAYGSAPEADKLIFEAIISTASLPPFIPLSPRYSQLNWWCKPFLPESEEHFQQWAKSPSQQAAGAAATFIVCIFYKVQPCWIIKRLPMKTLPTAHTVTRSLLHPGPSIRALPHSQPSSSALSYPKGFIHVVLSQIESRKGKILRVLCLLPGQPARC